MIKIVYWSSCKVPVIVVRFWYNLNFLDRFSKNAQVPNFIKIRRVGAELCQANRRTHSHDEANSHFSQFCESGTLPGSNDNRTSNRRNAKCSSEQNPYSVATLPQNNRWEPLPFTTRPTGGSLRGIARVSACDAVSLGTLSDSKDRTAFVFMVE